MGCDAVFRYPEKFTIVRDSEHEEEGCARFTLFSVHVDADGEDIAFPEEGVEEKWNGRFGGCRLVRKHDGSPVNPPGGFPQAVLEIFAPEWEHGEDANGYDVPVLYPPEEDDDLPTTEEVVEGAKNEGPDIERIERPE